MTARNSRADVQAHRDPDAELVQLGGSSYAMPKRFCATVTPDDSALPVCHLSVVIENGRPVCDQLRVERRPGGAPVSGDLLRRLTIGEYVQRAADDVARWVIAGRGPVTVTIDGETFPLPSEQFDDGHVASPIGGATRTKEWRAANREPGERRLSEETLGEVARIYREALLSKKPPTNAVAAELHVARSTAGRWVGRARKAGLLRPAPRRGAAGERP